MEFGQIDRHSQISVQSCEEGTLLLREIKHCNSEEEEEIMNYLMGHLGNSSERPNSHNKLSVCHIPDNI
jgi:hypothetical protein